MQIARDRYLDDSTRYHLTLRLDTRTNEMHSLLSDAATDVEGRIGDILVRALDEIAGVLRTGLRTGSESISQTATGTESVSQVARSRGSL